MRGKGWMMADVLTCWGRHGSLILQIDHRIVLLLIARVHRGRATLLLVQHVLLVMRWLMGLVMFSVWKVVYMVVWVLTTVKVVVNRVVEKIVKKMRLLLLEEMGMKVVRVVLVVRLLREDVFMVAVSVQKVFIETRRVEEVFGEVAVVVVIGVDVVAVAHQLLERRMGLIHISLHGEFR